MIRKTAPFILTLAVFVGSTLVSVRAQETAGAQTASPAASEQTSATPNATAPAADVDLSITANVTARELRFEAVPNPKVEFTGKPARTTLWEAERQNLPRPIEPGVTYRNIGIRLKITSVFADIDRIVAEALGEVPVRDDSPPDQQQQPAPPSEAAPPAQPPAQPEREGSPL